LKQQGYTLEDTLALLGHLDIQPTMTAHPTEARRRSILFKQQYLAAVLTRLRRCEATPHEQARAQADVRNQIALLMSTDEVRAAKVTVDDEVEHGLYFLNTAIWETLPRIHDDVRRALKQSYGEAPDVAPFIPDGCSPPALRDACPASA
jgi:phosphoenolpyruvate carboxylase